MIWIQGQIGHNRVCITFEPRTWCSHCAVVCVGTRVSVCTCVWINSCSRSDSLKQGKDCDNIWLAHLGNLQHMYPLKGKNNTSYSSRSGMCKIYSNSYRPMTINLAFGLSHHLIIFMKTYRLGRSMTSLCVFIPFRNSAHCCYSHLSLVTKRKM